MTRRRSKVEFSKKTAAVSLEEHMSVDDQVSALERVLTNYVERYGFTEEAREYFMQRYLNGVKDEEPQPVQPKRPK